MKKSLIKKIACGIMAAAMTLTVTSCGKSKEVPLASKDNVYTTTEVPMPEAFDYVQTMGTSKDNIFIIGTNSDYDDSDPDNPIYTSETKMSILDMDGNLVNTVIISSEDGTSNVSRGINSMCVSDDGTVSLLINEYTWNEETYESDSDFFIEKYDSSGNLTDTVSLDALKKNLDDDYFYISSMTSDNDGYYYLSANSDIFVCDGNGNTAFTIKGEEEQANSGSWINGLCRTADGRVAAIINSYVSTDDNYTSTTTAKIIDTATGDYGEEYALNNTYYNYYNGSGECDLYFSTGNTLCGINFATGETTTLIDWLKSGFDTTTMDNATIMSDGRILCTSYQYETMSGGGYSWGSDMILTFLTKVDPADVPDKELITLYCYYLNYDVRQKIVEFNKESDKYQIEVTTYSDYDDGSDDADAGLTKLNNDLIAGNIPDILLITSTLPVDSYISKGILADMYTFIDNDEELSRDDFLTNILDAYSVNGKLYQLVPSFEVITVAAKSSIVGDAEGWTMDDYLAVANANPDKAMFAETTKTEFLTNVLTYCVNSFINNETGECYFNTDNFKKVLEAANAYPDEIDYDTLYSDDDYWTKQEASYRNNETILAGAYLYNFTGLPELEQGKFGEDITLIGYPSDGSSNGGAIAASLSMAITSKAKNSEGAWEFIRSFLTDDAQSNASGFPLRISAYDALMESAKEKPYYMDGDEKVEYDRTYWIGETQITINDNTDEDNERLFNYIKSLTTTTSYDTDLTNIITEEAGAYFSGQKTVDDVADIIQNRATTYINENR
jgi:hypothetical protein